MLVLSRHRNEAINIGEDVEVIVVEVRGDKVRLGINAPAHVPVHRGEVYESILKHHGRVDVGLPKRSRELDHMASLAQKLKAKLASEPKELNWLIKTIDLWLLDLANESAKKRATETPKGESA